MLIYKVVNLIIISLFVLISGMNRAITDQGDSQISCGSSISDLVLIYHGSTHRPDWNANRSNPPGIHFDKDGKPAGLNNCSNMYLITGQEKVLLI